MKKDKIEPYYQARAKEIIDSMFNCKIFADRITRDDMNGFEDLIAFLMQSNAQTQYKLAEFAVKYKDKSN